MGESLKIQGSLLAKNTGLNFIGQVIPLLVAVVTIPYIIRGLGVERFGILSLAWVILGYSGLVDLGLSRATTKFIAEALGAGERGRVPQILWTSLLTQVALGMLGGVVLAAATPLLVEGILRIPDHLTAEAKRTFCLLALSVPVVICSLNLRGALEAAQRFDLVNAVRIPLNSFAFLLPAIGVSLGLGLPGIIAILNIAWLSSVAIYGLLNFRLFPGFMTPFFSFRHLGPLLSFGGWISLCNVLVPILVYFDRFLIGALASVEVVAYYTVPYEIASRLLVIPSVMAATLFPAWSTLSVADPIKRNALYGRSLKYILLALGPVVAVIALFSRDILGWWVGDAFAEKSGVVFRLLAVGMLLNALAQMPANILDAVGRPDVRAKLFLSYIPVYLFMLWFLVMRHGVEGAALAWLLRAGLELVLFLGAAWKHIRVSPIRLARDGLALALAMYALLIMGLMGIRAVLNGIGAESVATVLWLSFFAGLALRYGLDQGERRAVISAVARFAGGIHK